MGLELLRPSRSLNGSRAAPTALGAVRRVAILREAGSRAHLRALRLGRVLDRTGIESVDLVHLVEPGIPGALALAGGLSGVGHLDLIVALSPQVEVDAARVAVQSGAPLARLRHAHPGATLRRVLRSGQVHGYAALSVEMAGQQHLAVDHVVIQLAEGSIHVRLDEDPLPDGRVVQVVAANPLAGLPRSPTTLDPSSVGSVTVLSPDDTRSHGYGLGPNQRLSCNGRHRAEVRIDGRLLPREERDVSVLVASKELKLVVIGEAGDVRSRSGGVGRRGTRR